MEQIFFSTILLATGLWLYAWPPAYAEGTISFRSIRSLANEDNWKKAQKLFSKYCIQLGMINLVLESFTFKLGYSNMLWSILLVISSVIILIYKVESEI